MHKSDKLSGNLNGGQRPSRHFTAGVYNAFAYAIIVAIMSLPFTYCYRFTYLFRRGSLSGPENNLEMLSKTSLIFNVLVLSAFM